jgi:outer membrane lipoprotein-sorting protein
MMRLSFGVRSFAILLGLLLTGCSVQQGTWGSRPPPSTILSTVQPAWRHLVARRRIFQNLKGLARVRFESPEQAMTIGNVVAVLRGSEALRLEGVGPLGQPLFLMVAHDMRFLLYMPRQARLVSGTASAENLSRLFGLAVAPEVLRYVLIGDVPLAQLPSAGEFKYLPADNLYIWSGHDPEHLYDYRVWFDPYRLNPVRFEMAQPPIGVVLRVQYEGFQRLQQMAVPYHITIEQPLAEHRVVWHYREIQLNAEVPASLFHIIPPAGTERIELD